MKMGSAAFAALLALGGGTSPAPAADIRVKAPVYRATPVVAYSWSGFYIGANAGYAWGKTDVTASAAGPPTGFIAAFQNYYNTNGTFGLSPRGFVGGAQTGFNYQTGMLVYGLEADVQYFTVNASRDTGAIATPNVGQTARFQDTLDASWLVTIRPRVGVAFDRTLLYATGGMAISRLKLSQRIDICNAGGAACPPFDGFLDGSASSTKIGWVLGGGIEHALIGNWTVKAEYLYVDLGNVELQRFLVAPVLIPSAFIDSTANLKAHIARFGINYMFYSGGPVVAKY
jgi:outer membrane immunogenic protein